jgi:DNA-binding winged helix-turn-helix (wHTH) protein
MKKHVAPVRKIYFLDFIFNPQYRTLQLNDSVVQLRKKQSDVLKLLCDKYPEPVSQDEFLVSVWGNGYVTPQSIAQIICSLRASLGDDTKSIIATIPKLGYQLMVKPCWEEPEVDNTSSQLCVPSKLEKDNLAYSMRSMINITPEDIHSRSVIPFLETKVVPDKKKFSPKMLFLFSVAALFFSLIFFVMAEKSKMLDSVKSNNEIGGTHLTESIFPKINNLRYYSGRVGSVNC